MPRMEGGEGGKRTWGGKYWKMWEGKEGGEEDLKEGEVEGANPPREEPKNLY